MVRIKIISGPRVGQENIVEMAPQDLITPARQGWRWEVDYSTVPTNDTLEWSKQDLVCKIISCLVRGGEVILNLPLEDDQKWSGDFSEELAGSIEDAIVYSGYSVTISEDSENQLVISGVSLENNILQ